MPHPMSHREETSLLLASSGEAILRRARDPLDPIEYRFGTAIYKGTWEEKDGRLVVLLSWEERWGENVLNPERGLEAAHTLSPPLMISLEPMPGDRFHLAQFDVEPGMRQDWRVVSSHSLPVVYLARKMRRAVTTSAAGASADERR